MKVKIFSFSDDVPSLEKTVNEWLNNEGLHVEIVDKTQTMVFDDYKKMVVITITIWYSPKS